MANLTQGNESHKYDLYRRKGILAGNQMGINRPWINLGLKLGETSLPLVICSLEYNTIRVVVWRNTADFNI